MAETKTTPDRTTFWLYVMSAGLAAYCYYAMTETKVYGSFESLMENFPRVSKMNYTIIFHSKDFPEWTVIDF